MYLNQAENWLIFTCNSPFFYINLLPPSSAPLNHFCWRKRGLDNAVQTILCCVLLSCCRQGWKQIRWIIESSPALNLFQDVAASKLSHFIINSHSGDRWVSNRTLLYLRWAERFLREGDVEEGNPTGKSLLSCFCLKGPLLPSHIGWQRQPIHQFQNVQCWLCSPPGKWTAMQRACKKKKKTETDYTSTGILSADTTPTPVLTTPPFATPVSLPRN